MEIYYAYFLLFATAVVAKDVHEESYTLMSSLSIYESVRGDLSKDKLLGANCKPVRFWLLMRHGTRYPGADEIVEIEDLSSLRDQVIANHVNGRGKLTEQELRKLLRWTFDPSIANTPYFLTQSGFNETLRFAHRLKKRFPKIFNKKYDKKHFYFQHSETERTTRTSYAFINGIFGDGAYRNVEEHVTPASADGLLYPFAGACRKITQLLSTPSYIGKITELFKTKEYLKALKIVSARLGFAKTLNPEILVPIFGSCAYDKAWNQETTNYGAWCPALGREGRMLAEYYWDVFFNLLSGYSEEQVTHRYGCEPVQDLWQRFAEATGEIKSKKKSETMVGLFSHDIQLLAVLSSMGLYKDNPTITPDNYPIQHYRKWRTSLIVPFASNIAAVLYKCANSNKTYEYKVLLLQNEKRLLGIEGCPNGLCKWSDFKKLVKPVADGCNLDEICRV